MTLSPQTLDAQTLVTSPGYISMCRQTSSLGQYHSDFPTPSFYKTRCLNLPRGRNTLCCIHIHLYIR